MMILCLHQALRTLPALICSPLIDSCTLVRLSLSTQNLRVTMRSFPWAPVVFTTATTGQRTQQILTAAAKARGAGSSSAAGPPLRLLRV